MKFIKIFTTLAFIVGFNGFLVMFLTSEKGTQLDTFKKKASEMMDEYGGGDMVAKMAKDTKSGTQLKDAMEKVVEKEIKAGRMEEELEEGELEEEETEEQIALDQLPKEKVKEAIEVIAATHPKKALKLVEEGLDGPWKTWPQWKKRHAMIRTLYGYDPIQEEASFLAQLEMEGIRESGVGKLHWEKVYISAYQLFIDSFQANDSVGRKKSKKPIDKETIPELSNQMKERFEGRFPASTP